MCGRKSRKHLVLSVVFCLLFSVFLCSSLSAEVVLTDEEAQLMIQEMEKGQNELIWTQQKLEKAENQLKEQQDICNQQKTSYEMQLTEANKENKKLKNVTIATSSSSLVLLLISILLLL